MKKIMFAILIAIVCMTMSSVAGLNVGTIIKPSSDIYVVNTEKIEWTEFEKEDTYNVTLLDENKNYVATIIPNETELFVYEDFSIYEEGIYNIEVEGNKNGQSSYKEIEVKDKNNIININIIAGIVIISILMVFIYSHNDRIYILGVVAGSLLIISGILINVPIYEKVCDTSSQDDTSVCSYHEFVIHGFFRWILELMLIMFGVYMFMDSLTNFTRRAEEGVDR